MFCYSLIIFNMTESLVFPEKYKTLLIQNIDEKVVYITFFIFKT